MVSLVAGILFAINYYLFFKKEGYDKGFISLLIIMPMIVCVTMLLVSNDIAKAFSLGGVFALMRFKTSIKSMKNVGYLFSTIVIGFSCGLTYYLLSIVVTIVLLLVITVLNILAIKKFKTNYYIKIVLPESLEYEDIFKDLFDEYLKSATLKKIKTTDFGSLNELTYLIVTKNHFNKKEFIDKLRTKKWQFEYYTFNII